MIWNVMVCRDEDIMKVLVSDSKKSSGAIESQSQKMIYKNKLSF